MPAKIHPVPFDDVAVPIRQFAGTDQSTAPSFLDPSMLQVCQNWCPIDFTFLLSKRRGTLPYLTSANNARIDKMLAVLSPAGNRYLIYSKKNTSTVKDEIWYSKNDAAEVQVVGGTFPASGNGRRIGLTWLNNAVYAGNGVDPIFEIQLTDPLTAVSLSAPTLLNDTGQTVVFTPDATSTLPSGTLSYRYALYNTVSLLYVSIGPVQTAQTPGATSTVRADFTAPSTAPGANQTYHLFVAPVGQEIEGAHLQTPQGLPNNFTFTLRNDASIDGVPVPIPSTVTRTGNILSSHLGRVVVSGDLSNPLVLYCTDVLAPGLEQAIFNQGSFFPANGRFQGPSIITGVAVGTLTAQPESPDSPLLVFTATTMTGFFGDLVDDPNLRVRTLSRRVGCVSQGSIAYTIMGPMWCGQQSVYLYSPYTSEGIVDVGWPIWPVIRSIPRALRPFVEATFHKGFFKLAIPVSGATQLTQQWWLDLRRGLGDTSSGFAPNPAWFGPMIGLTVTTFAQSFFDPSEDDRGWAVIDAGPGQTSAVIVLIDQTNSYQDNGLTVASLLRTARIDDGEPFVRKQATRVRCIARVSGSAKLGVEIDAFAQSQPTTQVPVTQGVMDTAVGTIPLQGVSGTGVGVANQFSAVDAITTTASGSTTTVVNVASATGMLATDWITLLDMTAGDGGIRLGTAQILSILSNALTLATPLQVAPGAGVLVASSPANQGGQFAPVDALASTVPGSTTTVIAIAVTFQGFLTPTDWVTVVDGILGTSQIVSANQFSITVTPPFVAVPRSPGFLVATSPNGQGATFTVQTDTEGQFVPAPRRPRGQAFEVVITHNDAVQVDLRDLELLYQPLRGVL